MPTYSVTIYSDDSTLGGNVEYTYAPGGFMSYIGRVWDIRNRKQDGSGAILIEAKPFGNGVMAEDWVLDRLECPLFALLAK